ncbi:WhiB family transcriptional regulator [Streptomyces sp. adm13(2018)]|uniref:WhiB family transcriptional regulator n=1 Tax=Streptomyces sp. adm13(2018) TaxID=2479007 RepID=UPI002905982C|nr:WhiB family transcriptional regulator [Streptomyces sp. adm13(2018)]
MAGLTTRPATGTNWQALGLCREADPDTFFPDRSTAPADIKAICMGCPVRAVCLDYALTHNERYGVWGGLDENERRNLRRRRTAQAPKNEPKPATVRPAAKRPSYGGGFPPAPCGTEAAHRRHKRRKETVDEACAAAHAAYLDATREARKTWRRNSKARVRARQGPRALFPCGTAAAYSRHKRRGEKACDACREAGNAARRKYTRTEPNVPSQEAVDAARKWNNPGEWHPRGWREPQLTGKQWDEITARLRAGATAQDLAREYQISAASIRNRITS